MDWPAGFIPKMEYCKLVYDTLSDYLESGQVPESDARHYIVEDYMLYDAFLNTGKMPEPSDDNDFHERTLEFKELLDD